MRVYRGAASAESSYVEADRSRVDDYYLAEGSGLVRRFGASPGETVGLEQAIRSIDVPPSAVAPSELVEQAVKARSEAMDAAAKPREALEVSFIVLVLFLFADPGRVLVNVEKIA